MLEVRVDSAQLLASRFALSKAAESINALEVLARPDRAPFARRWVATVARDLERRKVATLLATFEHATWYVPDFLVPTPANDRQSLDDAVDAINATPPEQVRSELAKAFPASIPREIATVLDASGEAGLAKTFAEELRRFWTYAMAGIWDSIRSVLEDDIRRRVTAASRLGFGSLFDDLHPDVVRVDDGIRLQRSFEFSTIATTGIVLLPSVFLPRPAVWITPTTMLGYPAAGRGRVWTRDREPDDGSAIFGETLMTLLADLGVPRSTAELGRRHSLAPSTISYHLARLDRAGLVVRHRDGSRVLYSRTPRADATVQALHT